MDFGESSVLAVVTLSGCEASGIDVATVVVVDIAAEGCDSTGIFAVVVDIEATLVLVATLT